MSRKVNDQTYQSIDDTTAARCDARYLYLNLVMPQEHYTRGTPRRKPKPTWQEWKLQCSKWKQCEHCHKYITRDIARHNMCRVEEYRQIRSNKKAKKRMALEEKAMLERDLQRNDDRPWEHQHLDESEDW